MSSGFILQEEIDRWLEDEGEPYTTLRSERNIKIIPINTRKEKLYSLFLRLKELGATREFFVGSNRDTIAKACLPTRQSMKSSKYRQRYTLTCKDIDYVKVQIFGTASDEFKSGKTDVVLECKTTVELEGEKELEESPGRPVFNTPAAPAKPKSEEFDQSVVKDRSGPSDIIDPNLEEWLRDK